VRVARPVLRALTSPAGKLGRAVEGREGAADRLIAAVRDAERTEGRQPTVWVHAPSVGEGLMAQSIVRELRRLRPNVRIVYTWFSPSALRIVERVGADVTDYLPWDTQDEAGRAVRAIRPDVLACVRTEIWPVLVRTATATGARTALVNAVLSPSSGRSSPGGRMLLGPLYASLSAVGAVAAEDETMFRRLGVPAARLRITGDARFDQVAERVRSLRGDRERLDALRRAVGAASFTLVAGSPWPADETVLLEAMATLRDLDVRWVVAPHEPTETHLGELERRLDQAGLEHVRLSDREGGRGREARVVVVDRVGVLADLYALADAAWVGGGFGKAGLHSVIEPAALDVPVLYGPRHGNSREAGALAGEGGGRVMRDARELVRGLRVLVEDQASRRAMGRRAGEFVTERLGGARRNALLLAELLDGPTAGQRST